MINAEQPGRRSSQPHQGRTELSSKAVYLEDVKRYFDFRRNSGFDHPLRGDTVTSIIEKYVGTFLAGSGTSARHQNLLTLDAKAVAKANHPKVTDPAELAQVAAPFFRAMSFCDVALRYNAVSRSGLMAVAASTAHLTAVPSAPDAVQDEVSASSDSAGYDLTGAHFVEALKEVPTGPGLSTYAKGRMVGATQRLLQNTFGDQWPDVVLDQAAVDKVKATPARGTKIGAGRDRCAFEGAVKLVIGGVDTAELATTAENLRASEASAPAL